MNDRIYFMAAAPFEAARQLEGWPDERRARLHGHSFLARVRAELPTGWAPFPGAEADTLAERLREAIAPLDYALLNEHVPMPTDENLARWIRTRLDIPGIVQVSVQSAFDRGVAVDGEGRVHCWRRFRFEAAHQLPHVPTDHQCGRMHGHGFEVILRVTGSDDDRIETPWTPLYEQLHLACLNDLPGLENPTSERLAAWLWARLQPALPELSRVTVYETATAGCHYNGSDYRIWKKRGFESALRLSRAPGDDLRRQLHGHSYTLRLHLTAPLDKWMGWTVDYGEVKALFEPLYRQLDHHRLDELPGLTEPALTELLGWMRERMATVLTSLDRIDLEQTPGCGAMLCWSDHAPGFFKIKPPGQLISDSFREAADSHQLSNGME